MPSIYWCKDLGESWSNWTKIASIRLPDEIIPENAHLSLTSLEGDEFCYVLDPDNFKLEWSSWNESDWQNWDKLDLRLPELPEDRELYKFSVLAIDGEPWLAAIDSQNGVFFWLPIEGPYQWEGPFQFEVPPNWSREDSDIFMASDNEVIWLVSVNLEEQSIYFADWDGEEFGVWSPINDLTISEDWLELGVKFDGSLEDDQLKLYAAVYDDDYYEEEEEELEGEEEFES